MDDDIVSQIFLGNDGDNGDTPGETENTPEETPQNEETKEEETYSLSKVDQEVKEQQEKDILKKKKREELRKTEENFIPNLQNPMDFVNYFEIDQTNTKISKAFSNFLIQNHRKETKLKSVLEIQPHLDINKTIFTEKNRVIKSIYPKNNIIILCDLKGNIIFFSLIEKKKIKELSFPQKIFSLSTIKDEDKIVNCLDITDEQDFLFVGYQTGTICVFDLKKNACKYSVNKIHNNISCIELRYSHREKNIFHILSCDIDGNVSYSVLKDGTLGWRLVSTDKLIENKDIPIFILKFIRPIDYIDSIPDIKNLHQTAIFGAMDSIYIYSLEPSIKEITSIDKPDYVKDNLVPDIQIGVGKSLINSKYAKIDETNKLIMAISWGRVITFYDLPIKDTFIVQPYIIGHYVNDVTILKCGFLSNSVLFFIDEKFFIKIINTRKIGYGGVQLAPLLKRIIVPKNNSDSELQNETLLDKNILSQKKITDPYDSNIEKDIYQYTIVAYHSSLFILCKSALYYGSLVDWKEFLKKLAQKEEHLSLFSIGIDIYQGKMNALLNIPPEEEKRKKLIGDFLRAEIAQYVLFMIGSKKTAAFESEEDKQLIEKCMNIPIELCLEIESFDYLIKRIEPMFESIEYGDYFLIKMEPFILYDKIKNVILSEDIVLDIIDLYKREELDDVLSQLLLHINIKSIDNDKVKAKIKELNLFSPLIYLYMNGSKEDYFAPITIMFQYFNKAEELSGFTNYHDALETYEIQKVLSSKQYYGHKILWYLRLCLTGRKFPNSEEKMKEDLYNQLIPDMTYWLMTEKVMNSFLDFDPKDYFNILKNIFSLEMYHSKLVETAKDFDKKIAVTAQLLNEKYNISDIEPLTLIENLVNFCRDKTTEIKIYLYDFVIISAKLNDIPKKLRIEAVNFILSNYGDVIKDISNMELSLLVKNIIEFIKSDEMFNDFDYNSILGTIKFNLFDEVKLYILNKTKQYNKCLELFVDPNSIINDKINRLFNWIRDINKQLNKNESGLKKYKTDILNNLKNIAKLDIKQFELMVREIFPYQRKTILGRLLDEDKEICLKYVEVLVDLLNSNTDDDELEAIKHDNENNSYTLLLHIQLLCEFKRFDEILGALEKNHYYPNAECLKLCLNNHVYDSIIYLYKINGDLSNAVGVCLDRIKEAFNNFYNDIDKNQIKEISELNDKYLNKFEKYLNKGIKLCEENAKGNEDNIWFAILDELFKCEKKLGEYSEKNKDNSLNLSIIDYIQKIVLQKIKDLMERMCYYVSITRIMNVVSERNKNAGFKEFRELIMKILNNYNSQTNIFTSIRNLLSNLIFENEDQFRAINQEGELLYKDKCDECHQEFNKNFMNKENVLVFNCGHIFHTKCTKKENNEEGAEQVCPICNSLDVQQSSDKKGESLIRKQSFVLYKDKNNSKEFQVNVSFDDQAILKSLKKFDSRLKNKKRIAIENTLSLSS